MLVRDIYRPDVDCAESDEVVVVGARRMLQRSVGSLIIVDSDRRPVGIVTDRDLVVRVLAAGANPATMTLVDVMTPTPWTIEREAPLERALEAMREHCCRRIPVVDPDGRLEGIITLDDIVLCIRDQFERVGKVIALQSPRGVVTVKACI